MTEPPFKILMFMKRRPGMTMAEFQDYYENHHAPLCAKSISGVSRYVRRFVTPHPNPDTGASGELPFDVITELWFEDEAVFRGTVNYLSTAIMADEIVADEKRLFDRSTIRMATVVERDTKLS
jgi:uncharacterized protein (TIGR02118 family)